MRATTIVRWIAATAAGESLGLLASALLGMVLTASVAEPLLLDGTQVHSPTLAWFRWSLVPLGGLCEGACLGALQAWAIRTERLPAHPLRWTAATAVGMAAGWSLGAWAGEWLSAPSLTASGLVLGACLGAVLGGAQVLALRNPVRHADFAMRWCIGSAVAWAIGMVVAGLGSAAIPAGDWTATHFLLLAAGGLFAGASVGAVSFVGWTHVASTPNLSRTG